MTLSLQRADDLDLVLRGHAREDGDVLYALGELQGIHGLQFYSGDRAALEAKLSRDRQRRILVIAGDHLHSDARSLALCNGVLGFRPRRVHEADQPDKGQARDQPL